MFSKSNMQNQHRQTIRSNAIMIDGNTHALNEYQKQVDEASASEIELEEDQLDLSNDVFEGYFNHNYAVIDEVESRLADEDMVNVLMKSLRDSLSIEGKDIRSQYVKVVSDVCDELAKEKKDLASIEKFREEYDV